MHPWIEHTAIAVSAISGVLAAAGRRIDLFGVVVLALVTALGGGSVRDIALGAHPLLWIAHPAFLLTGVLTALATFAAARRVSFPHRVLLVADAVGLALYTILGTKKALLHGAPAGAAAALGVTTGIAGGMLRDTLLREIPLVFRREIHLYATAAIAGALLYAFAPRSAWVPEPAVYLASVLTVLGLRLAAIKWRLGLPDFMARDI